MKHPELEKSYGAVHSILADYKIIGHSSTKIDDIEEDFRRYFINGKSLVLWAFYDTGELAGWDLLVSISEFSSNDMALDALNKLLRK